MRQLQAKLSSNRENKRSWCYSQWKKVFRSNNKKWLRTYNVRKTLIGQGDDYITGYSLYYPYVEKYYKFIAIDISKHKILDADPKAIQLIFLEI